MTWSRLSRDPLGFLKQTLTTRGIRLTLYLVFAAVLFPSARFVLAAALVVTLTVVWTRDYYRVGSRKIAYLAGFVLAVAACYLFAYYDVTRIMEQRVALSPWGQGVAKVADGRYTGVGEGYRGPIRVGVEVKDHRIVGLETLDYPDVISVLDTAVVAYKKEILEKGALVRPQDPELLRGARQTLTGYADAIESALTAGIPGYPRYSRFSEVFLTAFIGRPPDRVTLNALAILFAAFLVFEYALQSMITPGTGRSINCYNCASCVGACPVKEVEGVQMPMGLVLLTRLGDYERVMELSKYCVGCGRCACKCPIGNSGPLVISAAFMAYREKRAQQALDESEETA
ncbi:MAG: hypothetical protein V2B18_18990 [Pseudomonadota bacterium]